MEGTLAEIRMFGGNFAPSGWSFCDGSSLSIAQYTALFTLIGTTYGGDGKVNFALPNLKSRVPVGTGSVAGMPPIALGMATGVEQVVLTTTQMPSHTHQATVSATGSNVSFSATLNGLNNVGGLSDPTGNMLGQDTSSGTTSYAAAGTPVPMNAGSVQLTDLHMPSPNVNVGAAGAFQPHINVQPVLAVNFIICLVGIFPSRN